MMISTLAFACMNTVVKYLVNVNPHQIVFFRSAGSLFFTFGFLIKNRIPVLGNNRGLMVLRGLVGVTSMTLFFMSVKYLPVGTAVSLRYLAPIFAAILSIFFLRQKVAPLRWLFFAMAFGGVLVLKGFDTQIDSYGLMLVLIASVFSGMVYVIISKIGSGDHPVVIVNYFMVIATITGGLLSIGNWKNPEGIEWLLLSSLGFFGYLGQIYMTRAFQKAPTSHVAPLKYIEVIFTLILGLSLFGEIYTFWSLLGIAMIMIALILNVLYKNGSQKS